MPERAGVAQLVEHFIRNEGVPGSSPVVGSGVMGRMHANLIEQSKHLGLAVVLTALLMFAVGGAAKAEERFPKETGSSGSSFNGGFAPKELWKTAWTPVEFRLAGEIEASENGLYPEQLRKLTLEADRSAGIDLDGLPTCTAAKLRVPEIAQAEAACGPAIVGRGTAAAGAFFPGDWLIVEDGHVIAFNGGIRGGVATILLHIHLAIPAPDAIVAKMRVKRIDQGRFGLLIVTTIPKFLGGDGHVTSFDLTFKPGVFVAKCPDGKLRSRGVVIFEDGSRITGESARTCRPRR